MSWKNGSSWSTAGGAYSMEYAAGPGCTNQLHVNHVELDWEEKLQALLQIWQWIDYAVVWKNTPNRALEWSTGYYNDRSLASPSNAQRLFYPVYNSYAFTSSSSRCAAKALSQRSHLWWTINSPRSPTGEPKDQFLQPSGIKTIVCLPGCGSDANMYCLELASRNLTMESSGLLHELQAFVSGAYVLPGHFSSNGNNILPGPMLCGEEANLQPGSDRICNPCFNDEELSADSGNLVGLDQWFLHAQKFGTAAVVQSFGALSSTIMGSTEEMATLVQQQQQEQEQEADVAVSSASDGSVTVSSTDSMMAHLWASMNDVPDVETQLPGLASIMARPTFHSLAMAFENNVSPGAAADHPGAAAAADHLPSTTTTAFAAAPPGHPDQHVSEAEVVAAATSSTSSFDNNGALGYGTHHPQDSDDVLALHDLMLQQVQSSSSCTAALMQQTSRFYGALYTTTADQSSALSAAACNGLRVDHQLAAAGADHGNPPPAAATAPGVLVDRAMHPASTEYDPHGAGGGGGGTQAAPTFENLAFHDRQQQAPISETGESASRINLSRTFESFGSNIRHSKHPRFDVDSGPATESAAAIQQQLTAADSPTADHHEQRRERPMIELWKNHLVPRIQESDRMHRRQQAADQQQQQPQQPQQQTLDNNHNRTSPAAARVTVQEQQQQSGAAAAAVARSSSAMSASIIPAPVVEAEMSDGVNLASTQELMNFSPGWHDDQANIAHNHKLAERDRRQKFKTKILTLRTIIPSTKKNDKLSVLSNTIDYIRQLKDQITALQKSSRSSSSSHSLDAAQQNLNPVLEGGAAAAAASGANSAQQALMRGSAAAAAAAAPGNNFNANMTTATVAVNVEVGVAALNLAANSSAAGTTTTATTVVTAATNSVCRQQVPELVINVDAPNNPQTLVQILTAVRELELEIVFLESGLANGQVHISLRVLVRSDLQQEKFSWYCNEVKESLERVLNHQNHGLDTSTSTNSDTHIEEQQRKQQLVRSKSV